jgi:hypothetical protein
MISMRSQFVLVLIVMALLCLPAEGWAQNSQVQGQATVASATPTLPDELAQVPAGKSDVTYVNGQLTIRAHNAPLIEVVRTVCSRIGAELDAKSEPRESVVGILGPGPAKEVLASLLNDSHVNYALGGASDDPNALVSVMIFSASKDSSVRKQVAEQTLGQDEPNQPQETSTPPPTSVRAAASQTMELLDAARSELTNGGLALDTQGDAGSAGGGEKIDMSAFLQQIETQLKAAAAAETVDPNSSQQADPASSGAGQAPVLPTGRPMHRKHH